MVAICWAIKFESTCIIQWKIKQSVNWVLYLMCFWSFQAVFGIILRDLFWTARYRVKKIDRQAAPTCWLVTLSCSSWNWRQTIGTLTLRTVPTIVIAHMFFASRDTRVSYRWCLPILQWYFCAVYSYPEKVDLSTCKYSWYPKRKLGVTMHFWEIIKLQFGKEHHTLLCILKHFTNIIIIIFEKCVVTPNFLFGFQ